MPSIAKHHNEWLSLLDISGPFLSMPVLIRVFPQGVDALDKDKLAELRLAYEEWLDNQQGVKPDIAIHSIWVRYVFEHILNIEKPYILEGQSIPTHLKAFIAEQGETLIPNLVICENSGSSKPRLLIQVYPIEQKLEGVVKDKRWKATPAMRMLELLRATDVQLGLVTNGEQWMLVNAPRGETSSLISWYASLWLEEPLTLRAFTSLLGSQRFFNVPINETLEGMLKESINEQQEVTDQLGYQVRRAVEVLIRALDKADQDRGRKLLAGIPEAQIYEAALTVMMRLVFLFSAEERGLLLLGEPIYDDNYAVSTLRARLRETADQNGEEVLERRFDAWGRLLATFRAVYGGIQHDRLNLPAYGGSLFNPDKFPFLEGRTDGKEIDPLPISNRTVLHLLEALQILQVKVPGGGPTEARRLSFRALDVEQIGHVYEGLLDHIAVRAGDIVLGLKGTREREPEVPLSVLKLEEAKGEKSYLAYLKEITGRSENALKKDIAAPADAFLSGHLMTACNNDQQVFDAVLPYAGLIREDDFGFPTVFQKDSVYLTAGQTRRATGTHYTPRSLTEPIVQHTLEPLVYTGPAEGYPKEKWILKSPAELLDLKICDMAMGSAGFLVQVIRYLSERLVEAWDAISSQHGGEYLQITPEGKPASGKPGELIIPRDDEEKLVLARRLVADRCIYGVDKNPLAVEIAKLSIWLTTMDKGRPFTFLDHALKCGDSLVGADEEMFRKWAYSLKGAQYTLYLTTLEEMLATARQKRKELESFTMLDIRDVEYKAHLLKEADVAMERVKLGCDLLVGTRLLGLKPAEQVTMLSHLLWDYVAGEAMTNPDAQRALLAARKERAFHWSFEFPEVFKNGGFDAFVGNPPFLGGTKISTNFGMNYFETIKYLFPSFYGRADICSLFLIHAFMLQRKLSFCGFVTTNTISQGDTKLTGLDYLLRNGCEIYRAVRSMKWIGTAAVFVSIVHVSKGLSNIPKVLNDEKVDNITSDLESVTGLFVGEPYQLESNNNKSFIGSYVYGKGFVISPEEAQTLLQNKKNQEVIFKYLNGQDLNSSYSLEPTRYVINFFDWNYEKVSQYPECLRILTERVKPERDTVIAKGKQIHEVDYWKFWDKRLEFYALIRNNKQVLVRTRVTRTHAFAFVNPNIVFSDAIVVFVDESFSNFAILQSSFNEYWAWKYGSTLKEDLRYSPTDCFQTFPYPLRYDRLTEIGITYHEYRNEIMQRNKEGLTALYNRFHDSKNKEDDIIQLRDLHASMDKAVANAYCWSTLNLEHDFHVTPQGIRFTISESAQREVLSRLLQLNHERYEEEVKQGLHDKKMKEPAEAKKPKKLKLTEGQLNLMPEAVHPLEAEQKITVNINPTPRSEISNWDRCKCLSCGKSVLGFSIDEHTQSEHGGIDPGYRKVGG
jgi:hypothetical protein